MELEVEKVVVRMLGTGRGEDTDDHGCLTYLSPTAPPDEKQAFTLDDLKVLLCRTTHVIQAGAGYPFEKIDRLRLPPPRLGMKYAETA